jgi:hypothetical protein
MIDNEFHESELGDPTEGHKMREAEAKTRELFTTSNEVAKGAFTKPIETLKWLLGYKK